MDTNNNYNKFEDFTANPPSPTFCSWCLEGYGEESIEEHQEHCNKYQEHKNAIDNGKKLCPWCCNVSFTAANANVHYGNCCVIKNINVETPLKFADLSRLHLINLEWPQFQQSDTICIVCGLNVLGKGNMGNHKSKYCPKFDLTCLPKNSRQYYELISVYISFCNQNTIDAIREARGWVAKPLIELVPEKSIKVPGHPAFNDPALIHLLSTKCDSIKGVHIKLKKGDFPITDVVNILTSRIPKPAMIIVLINNVTLFKTKDKKLKNILKELRGKEGDDSRGFTLVVDSVAYMWMSGFTQTSESYKFYEQLCTICKNNSGPQILLTDKYPLPPMQNEFDIKFTKELERNFVVYCGVIPRNKTLPDNFAKWDPEQNQGQRLINNEIVPKMVKNVPTPFEKQLIDFKNKLLKYYNGLMKIGGKNIQPTAPQQLDYFELKKVNEECWNQSQQIISYNKFKLEIEGDFKNDLSEYYNGENTPFPVPPNHFDYLMISKTNAECFCESYKIKPQKLYLIEEQHLAFKNDLSNYYNGEVDLIPAPPEHLSKNYSELNIINDECFKESNQYIPYKPYESSKNKLDILREKFQRIEEAEIEANRPLRCNCNPAEGYQDVYTVGENGLCTEPKCPYATTMTPDMNVKISKPSTVSEITTTTSDTHPLKEKINNYILQGFCEHDAQLMAEMDESSDSDD